MILNISNHPSQKWTTEQLKNARDEYLDILDLPFPNIPPDFTTKQINELAGEYLEIIQKKSPNAVHLMGEMTFTHTLVNKLKAANIKCVASTTNRIVEEKEGRKIVQFQFVQFREY